MTKNRLSDLNDHLFTQMERLCEEGITAEKVELEVRRTDAIVEVSEQIVRNAELQLRAVALVAQHGDRFFTHLPMLGAKNAG